MADLAGALNLLIYSGTIAAFEREQGIVRGEPRSILSASAFGEYFPNPGACERIEVRREVVGDMTDK